MWPSDALENLKTLRAATGLSQKQFADAMGVPLRTYENLEGGLVAVRPVHLNAAKWAVLSLKSNDTFGLIDVSEDMHLIIERAAGHL